MPALVVHAMQSGSRANGPGRRFVIWVQGCSLGCPGCFNAPTHDVDGKASTIAVEDLAQRIVENQTIDGVTISGGEPFEQADALLALVTILRARSALSLAIFSGFSREEITALPQGLAILASIDLLIDGRYDHRQHLGHGLRGSSNQAIHLLTNRHTEAEVASTPVAHIQIAPDGTIEMSGVGPLLALGRAPAL